MNDNPIDKLGIALSYLQGNDSSAAGPKQCHFGKSEALNDGRDVSCGFHPIQHSWVCNGALSIAPTVICTDFVVLT